MNPLAGDVFYLRMLLHTDHCKGKVSFDDLRTVNGESQETYQEVCRILGLLQDDQEWDEILTEGAVTKMCPSLRELFTTILLFCSPANPKELFEKHFIEWTDDFVEDASKKGIVLSEKQLKTLILLDIRHRLQSWDKNLKGFGLQEPTVEDIEAVTIAESDRMPAISSS